ncbi:ketopantoate reductase family protein [Streptomyces niveus]|uniref:ketopantoate reductase family protein n=1 Tax=Streptomyces niveus TaxID=193462 RepID=UPI0020D287E6|nr:2-dehydropantoate 2-reductase N-terminal domain-containing protein [Streptomyces niveus]
MGCHLGGHLVAAGYEVVLIGRPSRMDVLRERGLTLTASGRGAVPFISRRTGWRWPPDRRPWPVPTMCWSL